MDQLEVLKKEWQSREHEFPKVSYQEIYGMLLKKSSSIMKWIVIISLCEIAFWTILAFFLPESSKEFHNQMGLKKLFAWINAFNYGIVAVFIYFFYINYRKIQTTQTVKTLMGNILRARRTVHYFVYYNIGLTILLLIGTNVYFAMNTDRLNNVLKGDETFGAVPAETFIGFNVIGGVLVVGFLILFYWLLYGILLKRLKRNYRELKKMET